MLQFGERKEKAWTKLNGAILAESYETRREKPSVLVTSPGATDLHPGRTRHHRHSIGNANVGGRLQLKTSFDPAALQLVVTLICATGLTPNTNGQPTNPYAKLYLLPDRRYVEQFIFSHFFINRFFVQLFNLASIKPR